MIFSTIYSAPKIHYKKINNKYILSRIYIMLLLLILIPVISATSDNLPVKSTIPSFVFKEHPHAMLSKKEQKDLGKLFTKAQEMPAAKQLQQLLKTSRQNQLVRKK